MIISALASYYEQLLRDQPGAVARPGWQMKRVNYYLLLGSAGEVKSLMPVGDGVAKREAIPEQPGRSGIKPPPYFLCDKPVYLLPMDADGANIERFYHAATLHTTILDGVESPLAKAVVAYFSNAKSQDFRVSTPELKENDWLLFAMVGADGDLLLPSEDDLIVAAWSRYCREAADADGKKGSVMVCAATGELCIPAILHPVINGIPGAGANPKLVSFDKASNAFASYGHDGEQGRNAPVGEGAARAYGFALNYLLSNREHRLRMNGDTTAVFWSERADCENANLFSLLLGGAPSGEERNKSASDRDLFAALSALRSGKRPDLGGIDFSSPFHVLGLAPNKSRLVVRFYLADSFGKMLENVEAHYRRIRVTHAPWEKEVLTPYWLLDALERKVEGKKDIDPIVASELSAPLLRSILNNGRYPEALYSNCLLRVKATREVTYAQAAIIKAYLIKNCNRSEEQVTVELNEDRCDTAYNLGRAFAYLGWIQEVANNKNTLTGSYLDAACSRPAVAFPSLLRLSSAHLSKISKKKPGFAISLERGLSEILSEGRVDCFPKHLSLPEQGDFMLGYYHQKAKRYQKNYEDNDEEE